MSYRFARSPRWIVSHLLVVVLVVTMIGLGLWQLRRHDERAERNALIEQRADVDPVALDVALAAADDSGDLQYLRVEASGTYRDDLSVLVANRTFEGAPGFWVMTPLIRADGPSIWVARGFVGRGVVADRGAGVLAAPDSPVDVVGLLQVPAGGGAFAEGDVVPEVNRPDTSLLSGPDWADSEDVGVYIQAESDPSVLVPVPPPALDAGPHRSYAVQWFIFSLIAVIGYPLILRKVAQDRAGTLAPDDALV